MGLMSGEYERERMDKRMGTSLIKSKGKEKRILFDGKNMVGPTNILAMRKAPPFVCGEPIPPFFFFS